MVRRYSRPLRVTLPFVLIVGILSCGGPEKAIEEKEPDRYARVMADQAKESRGIEA